MDRVDSWVLDSIDVDGMIEYLCELVSIPNFEGRETKAQRSVAAHSGALAFSVTVPGKSAHACVREEGVSAIEKFIPLFNGLRALENKRNEPSIQFYKNLGAFPMDEWTVYRMLPPEIKELAEREV